MRIIYFPSVGIKNLYNLRETEVESPIYIVERVDPSRAPPLAGVDPRSLTWPGLPPAQLRPSGSRDIISRGPLISSFEDPPLYASSSGRWVGMPTEGK